MNPGVRSAETPAFNYRPVEQADLERVRTEWASRDLRARAVEVFHEEDKEGFKLLLLRHEVLGRTHYGAIFLPKIDDLAKAPVVVLPDGLDQGNPAFDIETEISKYQVHGQQLLYPLKVLYPLEAFIRLIPAFRGRSMRYNGNSWFSRGDFCDSYDGAADDSIAMLNAAEQLLPEVDFSKVLVWGNSRGGNTALLMAVRDPRINTVIAVAGPVDFYRESARVMYEQQYECQFFDGKSEQESRDRMIASSPLFFRPNENLEAVFLHHASQDDVVPVWNTHKMAAHLESYSVDVRASVYPLEGHGAIVVAEDFWSNMNAGITRFLDNIDD
jgi:predicted esterase